MIGTPCLVTVNFLFVSKFMQYAATGVVEFSAGTLVGHVPGPVLRNLAAGRIPPAAGQTDDSGNKHH